MANFDALLANIAAYVKDNANGEIGGTGLQQRLNLMIGTLGTNGQFMGVITAAKNMGSVPDGKQFWLAINASGSNYNISGTGLTTTAVEPGHLCIVHNNTGAWAVVDLSTAFPRGFVGVISSATNLGAVPAYQCFYVAYNTSTTNYNVTGAGSFSQAVAQNGIYIIHNLSGAWAANNIAGGLDAVISAISTKANNAETNANLAFMTSRYRASICICVPTQENCEVTLAGAMRIDGTEALDALSQYTEQKKTSDLVEIVNWRFNRIHMAAATVKLLDGGTPYSGIPNSVMIEDGIFDIQAIAGSMIKAKNLILNVPYIVSIDASVLAGIHANNGHIIVHPCLLNAYQTLYSSYTSLFVAMAKPVATYIYAQ